MTEEKKANISDDTDSTITMSRYVYECERSFKERTVKRLTIALIVALTIIFATNAVWIWYISQYDFTTEEITLGTDGNGNTNYIGQDGDINNGVHSSSQEK